MGKRDCLRIQLSLLDDEGNAELKPQMRALKRELDPLELSIALQQRKSKADTQEHQPEGKA